MMDTEYRTLSSNGKDASKTDSNDIQDNKVALSRFLGLIPAISFTLGLIIGTGIFLTPTGVLRGSSGSIGVSLIVWVVGAFVSSTGAMCMTELTIYFRQSGGSFVFLSSVYGPKMGFLFVWVTFFVGFPCSSAIQSMVIVNFLLTPFMGICDSVSETAIKLGATCVFLLLVFINAMSTRYTARAQVLMCFVKTGALIAIILIGAVKMIQSPSGSIQKPFLTTGEFEVSKLPSAFFSAYFAYGGWDNISNITEEVKKPAKTIVRAMTISFVLVAILYLLANVAYLTVLTPEEIMSSNAVAGLFAVRVLGTRWSFIIWLCVVLSAAGILNGGTYSKSRIYFVAARAGQFPFILSTIHIRRKTPLAAIITMVPITLLVIWSGNIWSIIDFVVCFVLILSMLTIGTVPYLRWKQPDRVLSYKAPLWSSMVYIVFTTALVLMTVYTNPIQIGISVAIICVAFICYGLIQLLNRSDRAQAKINYFNDFLQKLLLSVQQEIKTY
ncbi:Cystine/glutamate transporter [Holothuria leucospilota]|uniref:Cystine/glutamate transporter n=1 Tax=Holothuria leucospilota TaxID=206669 RepID=A0A9Q1HDT1_HOLLE|nr:Cystine/glutamate transporter [Holothuria leucospilota]